MNTTPGRSPRAERRDRIRILRDRISQRDGLHIRVEEDPYYEPDSNTNIPEIEAWEEDGFQRGELTAYTVQLVRPTPPCGQCHQNIPDDIIDALCGVVDATELDGTYSHPYLIPHSHVREIAGELTRNLPPART